MLEVSEVAFDCCVGVVWMTVAVAAFLRLNRPSMLADGYEYGNRESPSDDEELWVKMIMLEKVRKRQKLLN